MNLFNFCKKDGFDRSIFNCCGFAIDHPCWVTFKNFTGISTYKKTKKQCTDEKRALLNFYANELASRYENVRVIKREREAKQDEEIVYFRLDYSDFHFLLKGNKKLIGKAGRTTYLDFFDLGKLYSPWPHIPGESSYDGPIVRLAVKRTNHFPTFHRLYKKPE